MSAIVVAGAAQLELLARSAPRSHGAGGSLSIEVGGAACRAAIEAAQCGAEVRLLTAMNDSAYSHLIASHLAGYGVETRIDYREELATGGCSAHLDGRGRLVSAVRANPLERVAGFDKTVAAAALAGASALVLAGELSGSAITQLARLALERGIRVYGVGAPEGAAERFAPVAARLRALFIAQREWRRLRGRGSRAKARVARALSLANVLTDKQSTLCMRLADGMPERLTRAASPGLERLAARAVTLHELHGLDLPEALRRSPWIGAAPSPSQPTHASAPSGALEQALGRFMQQALYDSLTGALNRASTEWELHQLLERRRGLTDCALAVLMLDIDHFKSVNDTYGHAAGDAVIAEVCRLARGCLRSADFIGRWGGEEFIAVLPGARRAQAEAVAERMRGAIESGIRSPRPVTVSIGVADTDNGAAGMQNLIERADRALYAAKREGRNCVRYARAAPEVPATHAAG